MSLPPLPEPSGFLPAFGPGVDLRGLWSGWSGQLGFDGPTFSDRADLLDFAAYPWLCGVASCAHGGRLRFTHGWAADPDGLAGERRRPSVATTDPAETARQGTPVASGHECLDEMQTSPANASVRLRTVASSRPTGSTGSVWKAGLFALALGATVASAVWTKRSGGLEFSAPALAAVEHVEGVRTVEMRDAAPEAHVEQASFASPAPEFTVERVEVIDPADAQIRYFDGRAVRPVKVIWMLTTAYSPDERSCGASADGITASTRSVWTNGMKMVAADTKVLKMHSLVSVPGYHNEEVVPVLDRGGKIKGNRLDLLYPTHERALQWGAQRLPVTVWEYVD